MDISGTRLRALRAALFTALVVTLSTASHVLLSQVPLPLNTVAAVAVTVFVVAFALAGRERGYGPIAALLIPLELAADTVFTTGQHVCYGRAGGPVAGALRSVGWDLLCGSDTQVGTPLARVTHTGGDRLAALLAHADPAAAWLLLGAHIGVGLLAAAWLRRGERALAQLLRAVGATAWTAVRPLQLAVSAVTVRPATAVRRMWRRRLPSAVVRDRLFVHSLGRRGPPCSVALV
ncbi:MULTISPECIES: hypothetical protein [unclassified Streptomyces]|uniref:hypothetical protein n=1 Tax=unclassified Streptomyces TaxID=2593676 RepID=UPI00225B32D7|nr:MULTISPECIES: hypothetical protein [unclassified Streptomyces]MCX5047522.1 hypothetical protein [Streptomyces sp. NBC_00474]MCX5057789.1 hypothetical protein [Streptomyces sp. NBC_00452]MCX5245333.1 hypothetical protein [Streptomyces sp. NBC_00201]MCX5288889.1 hypothetical protein [Streptomyces sp. NBC_00183]